MRAGGKAFPALLIALLGAAAPAFSQSPQNTSSPRSGDTLGTYVVRPGDTLKGITGRFLGDDTLWRENWRLNPNLKDPHLLIPGQELRIILDRQLPPRTVQVTAVARKVDQKPTPNPWTGAEIGDLLQEEDGLRTGERSSAEVVFDDETTLQLTEESLIFLRRVGMTLRGVAQDSIEIVQGQADLKARSSAGPQAVDIEIILGETTARPKPGPTGVAETRARQADAGGAELMVYAGQSSVAAGGAEVAVAKGMGTTVPAGGAPTPPERLLRAPRLRAPETGSSWDYSNLLFEWTPIPGAAAYVLEICRDEACSTLVERATGILENRWTSPTLPIGDLHWRVTAVAPSGLDGYPSATRSLFVASNRVDESPPVVAAIVIGNPAFSDAAHALVADSAYVALDARDDASGVDSVEYRWDGGEWTRWTGERLDIPGEPGAHRLETRATDRIGRVSEIFESRIDRIAERPQPPAVFATPSVGSEPPRRQEF